MDVLTDLLPALQGQWEGAAQWLYHDVIFDFLYREIDTFRDNVLYEMTRWIGGSAAVLLILWLTWHGYRVAQGKVHAPMEGVVGTMRAAFIITLAMTLTIGNSSVYDLMVSGMPSEIAQAMTGKTQHPENMVSDSLAKMEGAMVAIDALAIYDGSENLKIDKDRAQWLAGVGTAGPALTGGALLVMYRMALALFVGLAPLFILCLLFKPTAPLFQKWLLYGIGTLFGQAALAFWAVVSMKITLSVSAVFVAQYAVASATVRIYRPSSVDANSYPCTRKERKRGYWCVATGRLYQAGSKVIAKSNNGLDGQFYLTKGGKVCAAADAENDYPGQCEDEGYREAMGFFSVYAR